MRLSPFLLVVLVYLSNSDAWLVSVLYTNNQSHADEQRRDGPCGVEEGIDLHQNFRPTVIVP
jgi:hypothetical protein